ncbi:MAG: S9 family peptidase [Eubacteriaceae bacterium]|nr:S9 family peptidase [Eubacteriaceae bacterium]
MNKIKIEDLIKFRFPENIRFSPKGSYLAYQVASVDEKENKYVRDIFLLKNGKAVQMTSGGNSSLVDWDDDETMIITRQLKDDKSGKAHLFKLNVNGGEALPWVDLAFGVRTVKRVGDSYIFTGSIDANDPDGYLDDEATLKKKSEIKSREADYEVLDELPYWMNGAGFVNKKRTALFVMTKDRKGGYKVKRLTEPMFSVGAMEVWGDKVYFSGVELLTKRNLYNDLYCYDVTDDKVTGLYTKNDISFQGIIPFEDKLYVEASDMKEFGVNETPRIYEYTGKNSLKECFKPEVSFGCSTAGDCTLGGGKSRVIDGNTWYTLATVEDHNVIYAFDSGLNRTTLWEGEGQVPFFDVSGAKIAFCRLEWNKLPEVCYGEVRKADKARNISHLNDSVLRGKYVAKPERIDYESCGLKLHGWVLAPEGFEDKKTKFPAVLDIHGGPRSIYSTQYFHEMQVWVARGYAVMYTNIKGSDGRGDEFADIRDDYGGTDYQNLMDFTDAVLKKYTNIDKKKVCETGGSYGGFMTNWIITHTDRFIAAASQRSISNWVSMSLISDIGPYFGPDQCGAEGPIAPADIEKLWDHSPLKYAENVKTPTLFIHSDQDYRCPLPEGMQMMQALIMKDVDTKMVLFHGENHELSRSGKPLHRIRRLKEISEWFDKYCKPKK